MVLSQKEIYEQWPNPKPKTTLQPDFSFLRGLTDYLKSACQSIRTTLGGGNHGHLFVVISADTWTTIVGTVFKPPEAPPLNPVVPQGATGPVIAEARQQHEARKEEYELYLNVVGAARKVIVESVNPIYLRSVKNSITFYNHLSPLELLNELTAGYGTLHPHQIETIDNNMKKPWSPNDPFEVIIDQIEEGIDLMEVANQPYTAQQILTNAYLLVHKTGLYLDECRRWRELPAAQKTWNNFKTQFLQASRALRIDQNVSASHHGFGLANEIVTRTANALDSLAAATTADRNTIEQVAQANAALTKTNNDLSAQLTKTNRALQELTDLVNQLANNTSPPTNTKTRRPLSGSYCWTHGFYVSADHNSNSCKKPAPGHKAEATATNRMGGSTRGEPKST